MIPKQGEDLKSRAKRRHITDEDIAYSTLIESYPSLESLMNRFDLCSVKTGDRFIKTENRVAVKPQHTATIGRDYSVIMILAAQILSPEEVYTKDEIIEAIKRETKVSKKEAAMKFDLMVDVGVIAGGSLGEPYSFHDSMPF